MIKYLTFCATLLFSLGTFIPANSSEPDVFSVLEWQQQKASELESSAFSIKIEQTLNIILKALIEKYMTSVKMDTIIRNALISLSQIDDKIQISSHQEPDKIHIMYNKEIIRTISYHYDDSAEKWTHSITSVLADIRKKSPLLTNLPEENFWNIVLPSMLQSLDKNTIYYPRQLAKRKKQLHHLSYDNKQKPSPVSNNIYFYLQNDIAFISIKDFNTQTAKQVSQIVKNLPTTTNGLIIDLSNSNGGILQEAISLANSFLDEDIILFTKGKAKEATKTYTSDGNIIWDKGIAVIINRNTKSSSEAFALSLGTNERALIIGEQSFGKGTIQIPIILPNGDEIMLSWATIFSPDNQPLDNQGVTPTITITGDNQEDIHQKSIARAFQWFAEP